MKKIYYREDSDNEMGTPVCGRCVRFGTNDCPFYEKVHELTYVEWNKTVTSPGSELSKEEKQESWIHCEKFFD